MYNWENKTILIAEDETLNFRLLDIILRKTKAKIVWVKNGEDAVNYYVKNSDVDIILMDTKMPLMDGCEATKRIKEINNNSIIIAQSAFANSGEKKKSLDAGCDAYITKPYQANEMLNLINSYI